MSISVIDQIKTCLASYEKVLFTINGGTAVNLFLEMLLTT